MTWWMLMACGAGQTYEDAMRTVCDTPTGCEACARAPVDQRPRLVAAYLAEHVTEPEARAALEALKTAPPDLRGPALREAARKAGLETCALADRF